MARKTLLTSEKNETRETKGYHPIEDTWLSQETELHKCKKIIGHLRTDSHTSSQKLHTLKPKALRIYFDDIFLFEGSPLQPFAIPVEESHNFDQLIV